MSEDQEAIRAISDWFGRETSAAPELLESLHALGYRRVGPGECVCNRADAAKGRKRNPMA